MKIIRVLLFLIAIALSNLSIAQIDIMSKFELGDYRVGFKNMRITDFGRSYEKDFRSVQAFMWYPAEESKTETLKYEEYFRINDPKEEYLKSGLSDIQLNFLIEQEVKKLNENNEKPIILAKYKELTTFAQAKVPILEGTFPLLLFAPGGNTSGHLNSVICEYLASHGYIVASFPSLGNVDSLRWPFNQIGLNLHIDDMELVINHLKHNFSEVNIDKTGLVSWSVGGVSQAIYSMKNSNIDLLISMDSGLGRTYGIQMIKESPYFDYDNFVIPYLHFTGNQPEMYNVERNTEFYDSIASLDKHSLVIEEFAHQHFAAQLGIIPALASESEITVIIEAYIELCQLILGFSNAYLKGDMDAKQEWSEVVKEISF